MADLSGLSDAALAAMALAGQQPAYRALLERHRERVFRMARHHCGEDDGALEVTQQTFISAFAALERYDRARPFGPWLARIAINKSHDWVRRRRVRAFLRLARPLDEAGELADPAAWPDRQAADAQALRQAMAAIALLPARLKEVLVLRTLEGLSEAETAQTLGITPKAVETRLYRARSRLAAALGGHVPAPEK